MLGPRISRRLRLLGNADRKGPISLLPGKPWSLREILVDPLRGVRFQQLVNQARYVTMRHENQPSLTGLVFLAHWTQHWFGAVPLSSSCTACMRRTVLGYYQVVPAGLCATNSCRNSGAGKECT